jgi:hypothetical protein
MMKGFGEECYLPELCGIPNLAQLLQRPQQTVPWSELLTLPAAADPRSRQPALTREALDHIKTERRRYQSEIEEAENDVERADSEKRLAKLNAEALKVIGPRGPIDLNNPVKKYRANIHGRLKDLYAKLRSGPRPAEKLASRFESTISSNSNGYVYDPPPPAPSWRLTTSEK